VRPSRGDECPYKKRYERDVFLSLAATWGHSNTAVICRPGREHPPTQPGWHLNLKLLASRDCEK
jgi:hypothetical protein